MLDRTILFAAREMVRRLAARLPALAGRRGPTTPSVLPGLATRPAPMRPLHPPAAVNDNPLAALEAEIERDLRARGYLR